MMKLKSPLSSIVHSVMRVLTAPNHQASSTALAAGVAVGVLLAGQAFFNGRLADELGTPELAGATCSAVALIPLLALAALNGGFARARAAHRGGKRAQWWHLVGG